MILNDFVALYYLLIKSMAWPESFPKLYFLQGDLFHATVQLGHLYRKLVYSCLKKKNIFETK